MRSDAEKPDSQHYLVNEHWVSKQAWVHREADPFMGLVNDIAAAQARDTARNREAVARHHVYHSLPRGLKRLVDHPKLLGWYYRLRPSKRPVLTSSTGGGDGA